MSERQKIEINRLMVGVISVTCLLLWLGYLVLDVEDNARNDAAAGAFMRVGLLMGALWFALPGKGREAAWSKVTPEILVGGLLCLYLVATRPRALVIAVPVMLALAALTVIFRPKPKDRPRSRPQ